MNIAGAMDAAAETLQRAKVAEPSREARSLLAFAISRDLTFLIAHPEYELSEKESKHLEQIVSRRASREPFQYITGRQEFYGLDFVVTPDVLIPRPETEILVESAIELLAKTDSARGFEIGVGSGCISIAILKNVPSASGTGVDISEAALTIARRNAEMHEVAGRLVLQTGDVFQGVTDKFDLVVSNPPYIPADDIPSLQAEVRDHEPLTALAGGVSGLEIVEQIIKDAPKHLTSGGHLLIEIGFDQSERVRPLFAQSTWQEPEFLPDLQGIPRIVKTKLLG